LFDLATGIGRNFELKHAFVLTTLLFLEAAPLLKWERATAVTLLNLGLLFLEQLLHDRMLWLVLFALFSFYDVVHTFQRIQTAYHVSDESLLVLSHTHLQLSLVLKLRYSLLLWGLTMELLDRVFFFLSRHVKTRLLER
jgi:hypothetical protein